jgi:hypothetical protein
MNTRGAALSFFVAIAFIRASGAAADATGKMAPFRVVAGQVEFAIACVGNTDTIKEIKVAGVTGGSSFEKIGLRVGDELAAIDGQPVAGKPLSAFFTPTGGITQEAFQFTFRGRRGLFRKKWEYTGTVRTDRPKTPKAPPPPLILTTPAAPPAPSPR